MRNNVALIQKLVFFVTLSISFLACGQTRSVFVNPEYDDRIKGESVAVVLPRNEVFIENPDDVRDNLGRGFAKEVFMNYVFESIQGAFHEHSTFINIVPLELLNWKFSDSSLVDESFVTEDKQVVHIKIPRKGSKLKTINDSLRFVLFIEGFTTSRYDVKVQSSTGEMISDPFQGASLNMRLQFGLWDNAMGNLVAYGQVGAKKGVGYNMSKEDWRMVLHRIVMEIVRGTPFYK